VTPDTNLLEQWVREETLVRIAFVDGEELVSKGYIRASPLDCFISHVRPEGVYVREGGTLPSHQSRVSSCTISGL
jgi:hypothetical protein